MNVLFSFMIYVFISFSLDSIEASNIPDIQSQPLHPWLRNAILWPGPVTKNLEHLQASALRSNSGRSACCKVCTSAALETCKIAECSRDLEKQLKKSCKKACKNEF
ncbi:hypothetical protein O0L34_g17326 [Tuta absoluta]|nr:hypothetical protein O0L34_g17326 [Tuta absoluta]